MKIKRFLVLIGVVMLGLYFFSGEVTNAQLNNFTLENEKVIVENNDTYPFIDSENDGDMVVKSADYPNDFEEGEAFSSSLTVKFTGIGEIGFYYKVFNGKKWNKIVIMANGEKLLESSGNGDWEWFSWYSESAEQDNIIVISYQKNSFSDENDDCCYLKMLSFDETMYTPLLNFTIDDKPFAYSQTAYYDYDSSSGVLAFLNATNDYDIEVKLNGEIIQGTNFSYRLKDSSYWNINNNIEINYSSFAYKERHIVIVYNADLDKVIGDIEYKNDDINLFALTEYNGELVVSSTNKGEDSYSELTLEVPNSGVFSFEYLISNRVNFDEFAIFINDIRVFQKSGEYADFEKFSIELYEETNSITFFYYNYSSEYSIGDGCVYFKNISFQSINYASASNIIFNEELTIGDGSVITIENIADNKISLGDLKDGVSVEVTLNGDIVELTGEDYLLTNLLGSDIIQVTFSGENLNSRVITFYLYIENVDDVFGFANDNEYPLIRTMYDGEFVIKTVNQNIDDSISSIRYTATSRGTLTIEYLASTEMGDCLVVEVNDKVVYRDSNNLSWATYYVDLYVGDEVVISYKKDSNGSQNDDTIYFKNISFEEKVYTEVPEILINGASHSLDNANILFDWNNKETIISFNGVSNQSIAVSVNGSVAAASGINTYDITSLLLYRNVVTITFSDDDNTHYDSIVSFNYYVKLVDSEKVSYDDTIAFVLEEIEEENVISLNPSYSYFDNEELTLSMEGKGYFKMSYKFSTNDNLEGKICFNGSDCIIFNELGMSEWNTINYEFLADTTNFATITINAEYYYNDVDYLYLKNIDFISLKDIASSISGDGSELDPFDYYLVIVKLNEFGFNNFECSFYNSSNLTNIYVSGIEGFSFEINGVAINFSTVMNIALNTYGKSVLKISNDSINIIVNYYNEGLHGSSITLGKGTIEEPYQITNEQQLADINKGLSYHYVLKSNIQITAENWIPIGGYDEAFTGSLDGGDNTIFGLNIISSTLSGLFGKIVDAQIKNLIIDGGIISSGEYAGILAGIAYNSEITNVTVLNANINISNSDSAVLVGGVVGDASESLFSSVNVSGNVKAYSTSSNIVGGITGLGGNIYSSSTSVDVEGNEYVGGIIGYSNFSTVNDVAVSGSVKLSSDYLENSAFGIISSTSQIYVENVRHEVSGTYDVGEDTVVSALLYGIGLSKDGISVALNGGNFSVNVLLTDSGSLLYGRAVQLSGYVIRFNLENNKYKYYELFDFSNNAIDSSDIFIDFSKLHGYENNFLSMEANDNSTNYEEVSLDGTVISKYLNIIVEDVVTMEHLRYVVNYGIPVTFGTYNVYGTYNLMLNLIISADLDFTNSDFIGLSNSSVHPFMGSIEGQNYKITLSINRPNSIVSAFINYYKNGDGNLIVKDLVLEGAIVGKNIAGFVGKYIGYGQIEFNNISNYMIAEAVYSGSLMGYGRNTVLFTNCSNYAPLNNRIFSGKNNFVEYKGAIRNFAAIGNNEDKKSIYDLFFGAKGAEAYDNDAKLENYYTLNVGVSNAAILVDGVEYISNSEGVVTFPMDIADFYFAYISGELLANRKYDLEDDFNGTIILPKTISLDEFNVYDGTWIIKANVELYDSNTIQIDLTPNLSDDQITSNELIFESVSLFHDIYKVSDVVTLRRISSLISRYKESFELMVSATDLFKEKALIVKENYLEMSNMYVIENFSEKTLEYYNDYLETNSIDNTSLNEWLSVIVDEISFENRASYITYGDEATFNVSVSYLDGNTSLIEVEFDYGLEDIDGDKVFIKSKEPFISKKEEKEVYNAYIENTIRLRKRSLTAVVDSYEFEYDGTVKQLNISIMAAEKFNDSVSNVIVNYFLGEDAVVPVEVGTYSVGVSFDVTNSQYYELYSLVVNDLVITPKIVDIVWEGEYSSTYDGENKLDGISAYYYDINGVKTFVSFDIDCIVLVGEYSIGSYIENDNYQASALTSSKVYVVNKADLQIKIGNYEYWYQGNIPNINVSVNGLISLDEVDVDYSIVKGTQTYNNIASLICGEYVLKINLRNEDELISNYNINLINGILNVSGISTIVVGDNEVTYDYKGVNFEYSFADIHLEDESGNIIDNDNYSYVFRKSGEVVDRAIDVGDYEIEINFEGTHIYCSSALTISLTINIEELKISLDDKTSYYGSPLKSLTYSIVEGEVYNHGLLNVVITKEEGFNVGTYDITATCDNSNYDITIVNGVYEILPRKITVVIDSKESDYLANIEELTYSVYGEIVDGDDLNVELTKENGLDAGEYSITGTYANSQYDVTIIEGTYYINKIDIENVVFNDVSTVYDGSKVDFGIGQLTLSDGSQADIEYRFNGKLISEIINAGTYTIEAIVSNKNYNTLTLQAEIVVAKAQNNLGYILESIEYEYNPNGVNYGLYSTVFTDGRYASVSYSILNEDDDIVEKINGIGEYVVVARINDLMDNYESKVSTMTIIVVPRRISVDYDKDSFVYNGNHQSPRITDFDEIRISFDTDDGLAPIEVGNYTMTIESNNENYVIMNSSISFTIEKLEVVYSNFEDVSYIYNGMDFNNTIEVQNKVTNDDLNLIFEYHLYNDLVDEIVDVGVYTVSIVGLDGESKNNYKLSTISNEMQVTVTAKDITVIPLKTTKIYGESDPNISYTFSEELYEGDFVVGTLQRVAGENVGTYLISLGSLSLGNNYNLKLSETNVFFEIYPKPIEIEYEETIYTYDGSEKRMQVEVSQGAHIEYEGDLVNAGTYQINVIIDDTNYCLPDGYEPIKVIINKKDISGVISLVEDDYIYNGSRITPEISCDSYDCEIKYYEGEEIIEDIIYPGTYKIKVSINESNLLGNKVLIMKVDKIKGEKPREINYEAYHNKIVMELNNNLEYRIDNGNYYSSSTFVGLREETKYKISVRSRETEIYYASDPIVYEIVTTTDPEEVEDLIDKLTENINEKNLEIIKKIEKLLMDVNVKEIDVEKYSSYLEIKGNFENAINSYEKDLGDSTKVSEFVELGVMALMIIVPMIAVLFVVKRKFEIL